MVALVGARRVHAFQVQIIILIQHESLETVFEEGQVLEYNEELRNIVLVHEESSEQHEGYDQHWSQCHC